MKNKMKLLLVIFALLNSLSTFAQNTLVVAQTETPIAPAPHNNQTLWQPPFEQPLGFYARLGDTFALSGLNDLYLYDTVAQRALQGHHAPLLVATPAAYLNQISTTNFFASLANLVFAQATNDTTLAKTHYSRAAAFTILGATSLFVRTNPGNTFSPSTQATVTTILKTLTTLRIVANILSDHAQGIQKNGLDEHARQHRLEMGRDLFYGLQLVDLLAAASGHHHYLRATRPICNFLNWYSYASLLYQFDLSISAKIITIITTDLLAELHNAHLSNYPVILLHNIMRYRTLFFALATPFMFNYFL